MRALAAGLAALLAWVPARAADNFSSDAAGGAAGEFLLLGPGARALAMGEAYTAVADDASAAFWNPAGLTQIPKASLTAMYSDYVAGITYQQLGFAARIDQASVVAGAVQLLDVGDITQTDPNGINVGTFHPRDELYSLSYARDLDFVLLDKNERVQFGVTGKFLRSTLLDSAQAFAADVGLMTEERALGDRRIRLAFGVFNIADKLRYDQGYDPLPLEYKAGGSIYFTPFWLISADVVVPRFNRMYEAVGTEFEVRPNPQIALDIRAGMNTQGLDNQTGLGGYSFGGGIRISMLSFDYAFVPMGDLGSTHRFSVTLNFPGTPKQAQPSVFDQERKLLQPD